MALQDMMVTPFRSVDEINQGLDDRNERLVFSRIVKNSTARPKADGSHSGQYFLITPKLLPGLTDMENEQVTVLFVTNGPHNFDSPTDWKKYMDSIKQQADTNGEENVENRSKKRKSTSL